MIVINQNTALIIFIVIIIISLIIAIYMQNYANYEVTWIHTFVSVLVGLGIFVTFLFYYAIVSLSVEDNQLNSIREVSRINTLLNTVYDEIRDVSHIIPNFVASIHPLTHSSKLTKNEIAEPISDSISNKLETLDEISPKTQAHKLILASKIFSLWENVIIADKILKDEHPSYITEFLQRTNSKQLYELWILTKLNYNIPTQMYGDLLFEYGLPINNHVSESYIIEAEKLLKDSRYLKIFK